MSCQDNKDMDTEGFFETGNKRSTTTASGDECGDIKYDPSQLIIPIDLIHEILPRLPAKSTWRFHCVLKLWRSILSSPYFTELAGSSTSLIRPPTS
ncbi:unnamed protein product [Cochlearia groenlandica]